MSTINELWSPFQFTDGSKEYKFRRVFSTTLEFSVKTGGEAHIALTSQEVNMNPTYEISIGEKLNKKLKIKKNKITLVEYESPELLNSTTFRSFWIRFSNKKILVGIGSFSFTPILIRNDPQLFTVTHFGIRTSSGFSGSWIFSKCFLTKLAISIETPYGRWVKASSGDIPPGAVPAGYDNDLLYVARVYHDCGIIPGKLHPSHGVAYFPLNGSEMRSTDYEVLCDVPNSQWKLVRNEDVPPNAVPGGISCDGEPLYIGRISYNNTLTVGMIKKNSPGCLISYDGEALSYDVYEVLCAS